MEDMVSILMRHSEEGETPERRAGGQMKGLLLKVNSLGEVYGGVGQEEAESLYTRPHQYFSGSQFLSC